MNKFSIEAKVRFILILVCVILFTAIFYFAGKAVISTEEPVVTTYVEADAEAATNETIVSSAPTIEQELVTEPTVIETVVTESAEETAPSQVLISTPVLFPDAQYSNPVIRAHAEITMKEIDGCLAVLKQECESGLYTKRAVLDMQEEIKRLTIVKNELQEDLDKYARWEAEYPWATEVWYFLRERGYSYNVAAGIIGNMMIETSGGSLALKPTVYNPTGKYYGLCQWSTYWHPEVNGKSFDEQLRYLDNTLQGEFKTFGYLYYDGFTYLDFLYINSPEEAAMAFAKVYERCGSGSYNLRKQAARDAYNYFMVGS